MEEAKISAVITTHNRKDLLIFAINSVLNQTYKNIECIVVDDASTDGTEKAVRGYIECEQIKYYYIKPKESKGGNYARNKGIIAATGEYLAFLDDDDEWLPTKIEKQVKKAIKTGADFVYCGRVYRYNNDRNIISQDEIMNAKKFPEGNLSAESLVRTIAVTSTMLIKKQKIIEVGLFDEKLSSWQDFELAIRIFQSSNASLVRENLVLYRVSSENNQITNNLTKWENSVSYIEQKHSKLISNLSEIDKNRRLLYKYIDGYNRARFSRKLNKKLYYAMHIIFKPQILKLAIIKKMHRSDLGY